jgi:hypothetical protein
MQLKHYAATAVLAAALALTATASRAADTRLVLDPIGPGQFASTFNQAVDGLFIDNYTFDPTHFSGLVTVALNSSSGSVSFFTASLNNIDFSFGPSGPLDAVTFDAQVFDNVPLTLTVFGAVLDGVGNIGGAGAYRGTITAAITAAIPEPQSYALMLVGLIGVAWAARRPRSLPRRAAVLAG